MTEKPYCNDSGTVNVYTYSHIPSDLDQDEDTVEGKNGEGMVKEYNSVLIVGPRITAVFLPVCCRQTTSTIKTWQSVLAKSSIPFHISLPVLCG